MVILHEIEITVKWRPQYMSGGTYNSELQIFKLFRAIPFTLRGFVRNLLKRSRKRNIFVSISDLGFELGPYV